MDAGTSIISPPGRLVTAEILTGGVPQPLTEFQGRCFTAGVPGTPYTIRVTSHAATRTEVIVSVDGRHVLDDEPGDPYTCHGLIIGPRAVYEFKGWRTSDEETREFTFNSPRASVAAMATGSTAGTGVIRLAVHREQQPEQAVAYSGLTTRGLGPVAVASAGGSPSADLGTGMGAAQYDPVGRTSFTRDGQPPDLLVIGYATGDALAKARLLTPDPLPGQHRTGYARYGSFGSHCTA
jgi:hypothetical protein